MAVYTIENELATAKINTHGAELISFILKETGREYMWNADEQYWKRTSPVLFPFVGKVNQGSYIHKGVTYPMSQHGFARDMEFDLNFKEDTEICFQITETEETKKVYPFDFVLTVGYELKGTELFVKWTVRNEGAEEMFFSIGAHPGFMCPINAGEKQTDCVLRFDKKEGFVYGLINEEGLLERDSNYLTLDNGELPIDVSLFDEDALIIENNQVHGVAIADSSRKSYVTVKFDAPLVGIWSPPKKQAPFICIEPWYGRCDRFDFTGELGEREWGNALAPGAEFKAGYSITIK